MSWYQYQGITQTGLLSISLGALTLSAALVIVRRSKEDDGFKILFYHSQLKFLIPWALVILLAILVFKIFDCYRGQSVGHKSDITMNYTSCCLYTVVLLLTNLNYSTMCNVRGDIALLVIYQIVLFAEIIYNGNLLIRFINNLEQIPKDYSILYVSIIISWQVLVMDLIFRTAYQQREKDERHIKLQELVDSHNEKCQLLNGASNSNNRLHRDELQVDNRPPLEIEIKTLQTNKRPQQPHQNKVEPKA